MRGQGGAGGEGFVARPSLWGRGLLVFVFFVFLGLELQCLTCFWNLLTGLFAVHQAKLAKHQGSTTALDRLPVKGRSLCRIPRPSQEEKKVEKPSTCHVSCTFWILFSS